MRVMYTVYYLYNIIYNITGTNDDTTVLDTEYTDLIEEDGQSISDIFPDPIDVDTEDIFEYYITSLSYPGEMTINNNTYEYNPQDEFQYLSEDSTEVVEIYYISEDQNYLPSINNANFI